MNEQKRRPIKSRVLAIVLAISVVSLAITSFVGIASMMLIRERSRTALTDRLWENMSNIVESRAALTDSWLDQYERYIESFAGYLHEAYLNPDDLKPAVIPPLSADNAGVLVMQQTRVSEDVSEEAVSEEAGCLANIEKILHPVMIDNTGVIATIYLGTEKGLILCYDTQSDLKVNMPYYDVYSTPWYQLAKREQKVAFTDVYMDSFGRGLTITCVSPFYDENDDFAGVIAMDILLADMYKQAVSMSLEQGAEAFLIDNEGNLISQDAREEKLSEMVGMDRDLADKIISGTDGVELSGAGVYYAYSEVESTSWKYCISIPQETVLEPVIDMNRDIQGTVKLFIAVFALIVLLVILIVRRFADNLTAPIIALEMDAKEISGGDLTHRAKVQGNDEISDLATSFNEMAVSLRKYIDDLTSVTAEKERIGAELNVATQIQADMLPRIFPPFPDRNEFDLYATMTPAKEVGGDFYDFFLVDDDHLGLVMADVSGKGVPAALFMVIAKTLIKNRAQMGGTPSEVLSYANEQLCEGNEAELFVTVWLAIIEISTGKGLAANAGHEHPVIKRAGGDYELVCYRHSPAVATMEGLKFKEHEFELHAGDCLFVYTDGVTEATDSDNRLYGTDRMLDVLNRNKDLPMSGLLPAIKADIDEFVGTAPQFDDITMLGVSFEGSQGVRTEDKGSEGAGASDEFRTVARTEKLNDVLAFIDEKLDKYECPLKIKTHIDVAVEEIFVNIAHYAYEPGEGDAVISWAVEDDGKTAAITFTDEGVPYNPLEKPDPDTNLSAEERQIGGLGIYMVKKSMDDMIYEYKDGRNILTIKKKMVI
ncbi:MAG: SpoIIE family protein phosphatase [Lachnospiraceae bacterium]|nr:SpoIIE family protein phosphatase [Lachnospiraceae bacterium]